MNKTKSQKARHAAAQRRYYRRQQLQKLLNEARVSGKGEIVQKIERALEQSKTQAIDIRRLQVIRRDIQTANRKIEPLEIDEEEEDEYEDIYEGILEMLSDVFSGGMSSSLSSKYHGSRYLRNSEARHLQQNNVGSIRSILQRAWTRLGGAKPVVERIQSIFPDPQALEYELERLAYGMYDREYSRWGGRGYTDILNRIKAVLR